MSHTLIAIVAGIVILALFLGYLWIRRKRHSFSFQGESATNAQVYVGNLAYRVHERDLRQRFEQYGNILYLKVVKNRDTGRSKGFGFVTFETIDQAEKALAVHGEPLFGRNLVVRLAKQR